jgi:hypothetical protein
MTTPVAETPDFTSGGIERRERCGGAIAFVVMRHRFTSSLLDGEAGLGAVQMFQAYSRYLQSRSDVDR